MAALSISATVALSFALLLLLFPIIAKNYHTYVYIYITRQLVTLVSVQNWSPLIRSINVQLASSDTPLNAPNISIPSPIANPANGYEWKRGVVGGVSSSSSPPLTDEFQRIPILYLSNIAANISAVILDKV